MAWLEIGYQTSPAHERIVDMARSTFGQCPSEEPWAPHLSLGKRSLVSTDNRAVLVAPHGLCAFFCSI